MPPPEAGRRQLRAAVLSAGGWSETAHLPALLADPACRVVAVSSPDPRARGRLARLPGIPAPVPDWRAALDTRPDAVVVSSPPVAHLEMATAALRAGANVLLEKPFAPDAGQAAQLWRTAAATGRQLLVGFGWPATPLFSAAHRLLAAGRIGRVEQLVCHLAVGIGELLRDGPATYTDPEVSAGGTLAVSMSHQLGMIDWLLGGIDATSVAAQTFPAAPSRPAVPPPAAPRPGQVPPCTESGAGPVRPWIDRHATVTVTRPGGGQLVLTSSATLPDRPAPHWRLDVVGSSGQLSLDSAPPEAPEPGAAPDAPGSGPAPVGTLRWAVRATAGGQRPTVRHERLPSAYDPTVPTRALLDVTRGAPVPDFLGAARAVTVCVLTDAAYRSAAAGGVPVPPALPEWHC